MEILGIDIGGSGIKAAPVDLRSGDLVAERHRIPTPQPSSPENITEVIKQLVTHFSWQGVVGCGFPAVVQEGVVATATNIDQAWIGADIVSLFGGATGRPIRVINDADAAGLAEMQYGAGKDIQGTVILVTIGTGIGSAVFLDGKLLPNTEFGHFRLKGDIAERYAADSVRKEEELSWKKWGKRFSRYLQELEMLMWPDLIILGGGASKKFERFEKHLEVRTKVVPAISKNQAGIVGAALAARDLQV